MSIKSNPEVASPAARVAGIERVLNERELLPEGVLDSLENSVEEDLDWHNGARIVARAWTDPDYRRRLLEEGTAACAELGFAGPQGEYIVALEATKDLHHVIVCTQCSCTAWPVLGLPPDWYKSPAYRARVVREPRRVLSELGLEVSSEVSIRVTDTTAETRFIVLPLRPEGTEGWSEDRLAAIVTREAMIGIARVEV